MSGPGRGTDSAVRIRLQELKNKLCCIVENTSNIAQNTDTVETVLLQILNALQANTDYEAALVVDSDSPSTTWLEVRIWNTDTQTFEPPVYYKAGTNTPGTPVGAITYINPNTFLAQIVSNTSTTATNTSALARTPNMIRPTGAGDINTLSAQFYSVSVANVGSADGTVLTRPIKPGEVLNFSADALNNYFTSFAYDATGTEFIIIFVS